MKSVYATLTSSLLEAIKEGLGLEPVGVGSDTDALSSLQPASESVAAETPKKHRPMPAVDRRPIRLKFASRDLDHQQGGSRFASLREAASPCDAVRW
ncbi:hypothetical protein [Spirillospora sp. NBC_01491]|uniref:hypothetical protein n=1 Tax=Spirillospora sp. NBC_01491 TaxID=2976007 RepID=UPI002E31A17D|nr:hypothetical protein [Spirillospora sp. NBC_01491]